MDHKISVLLADDNREYRSIVKQSLETDDEFEVIGSTGDGKTLLEMIPSLTPDVVVMDIILPFIDGMGVLESLSSLNLPKRPMVVVMSAVGIDAVVRQATELGASYYFVKPSDLCCLKKRLKNFFCASNICSAGICSPSYNSFFAEESNKNEIRELETQVTRIIHEVGIPAHIKGYQYLRCAIINAVENIELMDSVTKELYPMVAHNYKTTPSRVERAIRHAIEVAWDRGETEVLNNIFGYTVLNSRGKPTNSEFIAMIAERLRMKNYAG